MAPASRCEMPTARWTFAVRVGFAFFSMPHCVDHDTLTSTAPLCVAEELNCCCGRLRAQSVQKSPRPDSHAHMRLDVHLGFTRSCRSMYAAVGNQQIPWPSSTPLRSGRSRSLAVLLRQATSLLSFRHVNNSVLKRPSLQGIIQVVVVKWAN